MRNPILAATAFLLQCAGPALADSTPVLARVVALQSPAWIEHQGQRVALRPGAAVYEGDRLESGAGGRIQIDLEDASALQLGAQARFELASLGITDDGSANGLLGGTLLLEQGTLRFSGDPARQRRIELRLGALNAAIADSDVWAGMDKGRSVVCLVGGQAMVSAGSETSQALDQPQQCQAASGQTAKAEPMSDAQFSAALMQTDLDIAQSALRNGGRYRVVLASVATLEQADREIARLSGLGYPLDALPVADAGQTRYRLVIGGLGSHADAARYVKALKQRLGISAWVLVPA